MSGWIKFDKDMANDPRLLEMAVKFAIDANLATGNQDMSQRDAVSLFGNALRGALVTLWCYADEHIADDDSLDLSTIAIDAMVGIEGFCDALPNEWLVQIEDENRVRLPGYCQKNGLISKKKRREQGAIRQKNFKERRHFGNAPSNARGNALDNGGGNARGNASASAVDLDLDLDLDEDLDKRGSKNPSASATPIVSRETTDWFLNFKLAYPDRAGDQGWRKAQRAANSRMAEGHTPEQFIAGAQRYAAFVIANGNAGTEYVKQAATFLGPDKPFLLPWTPSASKNQLRQDANVAVSRAWLESSDAA